MNHLDDVTTPHEALAHATTLLRDTATLHEQMAHTLRRAPADPDVARLNLAQLVKAYDKPVDKPLRSIGILNPNGFTVYLGVNGSATLEGEAWPVNAECAVVLPVSAAYFEVGIDPADAAALTTLGSSTALVYVLRFSTAQPFFAGTLT